MKSNRPVENRFDRERAEKLDNEIERKKQKARESSEILFGRKKETGRKFIVADDPEEIIIDLSTNPEQPQLFEQQSAAIDKPKLIFPNEESYSEKSDDPEKQQDGADENTFARKSKEYVVDEQKETEPPKFDTMDESERKIPRRTLPIGDDSVAMFCEDSESISSKEMRIEESKSGIRS